MKILATILVLLLGATTLAQAADNGSAQLMFAGATEAESFVPTREAVVQDLGVLAGREQFSVSWVMRTGSSGEPGSKRLVFSMTAPKDGSAIQGFVLNFERDDKFAIYQARCVSKGAEGCDMRAEGIALDAKAKIVRFTNAKLVLTAPEESFPAHVVVNGTLKY